jgi:hypothetical protein
MPSQYIRGSAEERFWPKVNKDGPIPSHVPELGACWLWTGAHLPDGRGSFRFEDRSEYAATVAYILTYGPLTADKPCVLHKCDGGNLCCVRPDHLFAGTKADNVTDMHAKGRSTTVGETHPQAKLTEATVAQARARYAAGGISYQALADRFGVSLDTMYKAVRRKTWAHVV